MWSPAFTAQRPPFVERVDVARVLIDVRVLDDAWRPVRSLEPADFKVRIDRREVRVESMEWIEGAVPADTVASGISGKPQNHPSGRLIVVLVQKSLESVRMVGLMQMMQLVDPLLHQLTTDDRVAVLSFDSHLKIWTDFTGDIDRVRSLLREDVLIRSPSAIEPAGEPSLRLDQASAKKIYEIEGALRRMGEALEPLPGAKTIILLGYGFGRFNASTGGVMLMDGYDKASAALQRARASVFTLNVTQANYNSLQVGLQALAAETGGFYASTYEFPKLAIQHMVHAMAGHYVLFVDKPTEVTGLHDIDVRLTSNKGRVFARRTYVD
jgi:VWFA-related protein